MKKKHVFLKRWKNDNKEILRKMYPQISDDEIDKFLDDMITSNMHNPTCVLDNNYVNKQIKTTLLDLIDWINKTKPICGGHGVFYKNQHEETNPLALMIMKFLKRRKQFKSRLKDFPASSYEYKEFDRKQLTEKVNTNSIYGCLGMIVSFLFNKHTAPSVTSTGQSLISTTEQAFESFMTNNTLFNNLNECMTYLNNITKENYSLDDSFLIDIDKTKLFNHLVDMFYSYKDEYTSPLQSYINSLSQTEINHVYYKNNLYEFSSHSIILALIHEILVRTEEFKDPNDVPEEAEKYLKVLWGYYEEFVFYNHSPINRIQRLKNDKRKCVITIDTDSNFLNLNPWVEFVRENVVRGSDILESRDQNQQTFVIINSMAYCITQMMKKVLWRYTKDANVPKDYRQYTNIKNEFLMSRVVLASKKKRYISSIRLREGSEIYPEKTDIKGFDFIKSTATEATKERFIDILKKRILTVPRINVSDIIKDLEEVESDIISSLQNGEKTYILPKAVKELEAYADCMREQGVRAIIAWNAIYPDMEIELPAKVDIVKLTLNEEKNLQKLKAINPEIYAVIDKKILHHPNQKVAEKGLPVIAIPRNVEKIPDWMIPFIDYDTITYNVLSKFYPLLESLGLDTIKTSKKEYFSNILNI